MIDRERWPAKDDRSLTECLRQHAKALGKEIVIDEPVSREALGSTNLLREQDGSNWVSQRYASAGPFFLPNLWHSATVAP